MDYRYEVDESSRDFHAQRKAFIIIDKNIEFLPNKSNLSHFEYCQTKGITKEEFNKITRGYYIDGRVVMYKDNFIYDEDLIENSFRFLDQISKTIGVDEFDIYYGHLPEQGFALDLYYGKYLKGKIIKNNKKKIYTNIHNKP